MLTFGSVFAGIGGLDLGLERAGMRCRWQIEIDPYCRRVLAKHWPAVPRHPDVRLCDRYFPMGDREPFQIAKPFPLAAVDLICGGFPCQDVSAAGRREGIHGDRSGLFFELMRLVRALRPRLVLLENVAALLAAGRGMGDVLGALAESGYDAEWDCLPAFAVGAPHRRDRVFLVAHADERRRSGPSVPLRPGGSLPVRACEMADADGARLGSGAPAPGGALVRAGGLLQLERFRGSVGRRQWASEPTVGRMADGVPARVDRLRALGNAVVPQVAEWIGRRILASL